MMMWQYGDTMSKMTVAIGRADNPEKLPDILIPIGGDETTAKETAVYLAENLKHGFLVSLQTEETQALFESGERVSAEKYAALHNGEYDRR